MRGRPRWSAPTLGLTLGLTLTLPAPNPNPTPTPTPTPNPTPNQASERGGKPLSPSYVDGQGGKTRNTRPSQKGDERYRSSRPLGTTPRGGKPLDTPGWGAPLGAGVGVKVRVS